AAIVALAARFGGVPRAPIPAAPADPFSWAILSLAIFAGAYLEESYFRFYLLSKREEMGLGPGRALLLSTLLFALCHLYAGPWAFFNAAACGAALAWIFLRSRSFHGLGIAHGLYNVAAFALGAPR
ncbi:MAG: CPBP family glutamic-type intramembrane protease, partial [Treponema sp.]|nr:CPBP family glutamic-type intramembrane protease [Treponema sp.]